MAKKAPIKKGSPWKTALKVVLISGGALAVLGAVTLGGAIYYFSQDLPSLDKLKTYEPSQATRVYSDDRRVIGQFYIEKRVFVSLTDMPQSMVQAILAVEDARFYEHKGFDTYRIIRAFIRNLEGFEIRQGASTITQQLTRALFLTPEKTIVRKVKEILLARKIETVLTKDQILELYLNQIYFGEGAYGLQVASRTYFGKDARGLHLGEVAFLAGLPKAPNHYSPYHSPKAARHRQRIVLKRMRDEGYITEAQYERAYEKKLVFKKKELIEDIAPYFNEHLRQYLIGRYGADIVYKGGLKVYTDLNIEMQVAAETAIQKGLLALDSRQGYRTKQGLSDDDPPLVEGAMVVLNPSTGSILAMVGGYDFGRTEFNRAIQSKRQPGSAFKPIIFGTAIEQGFTPASVLVDNPVIFKNDSIGENWKPENYGNRFYGPTSLRAALVHSRNLATINLLSKVGITPVIQFARRLGIASPLTHDLSLALGTSGMSLIDLTSAYAVFANGGVRVPPSYFLSVEDSSGTVLEKKRINPVQVLSSETAFVVTDMLQDVIREGTGRRANVISRPVAGKTGTTNDFIDAWFIGYTPNLVAGVWVGFDSRRTLGDSESGGSAALPIWVDFMSEALSQLPALSFPEPANLVRARVDPDTGLLAHPDQERGKMELFVKGQEPKISQPDTPKTTQFFDMDNEEE
jgi:penicillin-binding protein 1A